MLTCASDHVWPPYWPVQLDATIIQKHVGDCQCCLYRYCTCFQVTKIVFSYFFIDFQWFFIDFHDFSLVLETFFGPKPWIYWQKIMDFHEMHATLRSCSSELSKPFWTSRQVFLIRIARSREWQGPHSMRCAARSSKFAKQLELFPYFPDLEDGPLYYCAALRLRAF